MAQGAHLTIIRVLPAMYSAAITVVSMAIMDQSAKRNHSRSKHLSIPSKSGIDDGLILLYPFLYVIAMRAKQEVMKNGCKSGNDGAHAVSSHRRNRFELKMK